MSEPIGHPIDDVNATRDPSLLNPDPADLTDNGDGTAGPTTPWEYEQAARAADPDRDERERVIAERARETATRLAQARLSNGDSSNAPHFLLAVEGREQCGQCGEPFPCAAFLAINPAAASIATAREYRDSTPPMAGELLAGVTPEQLRAAAAELGVSPDRLTESLNRYRPND